MASATGVLSHGGKSRRLVSMVIGEQPFINLDGFSISAATIFGCSTHESDFAESKDTVTVGSENAESENEKILIGESISTVGIVQEEIGAEEYTIRNDEELPENLEVKYFNSSSGSESAHPKNREANMKFEVKNALAHVLVAAFPVSQSPTLDTLQEKNTIKVVVTSPEVQVFDKMSDSILCSAKEVVMCATFNESNHDDNRKNEVKIISFVGEPSSFDPGGGDVYIPILLVGDCIWLRSARGGQHRLCSLSVGLTTPTVAHATLIPLGTQVYGSTLCLSSYVALVGAIPFTSSFVPICFQVKGCAVGVLICVGINMECTAWANPIFGKIIKQANWCFDPGINSVHLGAQGVAEFKLVVLGGKSMRNHHYHSIVVVGKVFMAYFMSDVLCSIWDVIGSNIWCNRRLTLDIEVLVTIIFLLKYLQWLIEVSELNRVRKKGWQHGKLLSGLEVSRCPHWFLECYALVFLKSSLKFSTLANSIILKELIRIIKATDAPATEQINPRIDSHLWVFTPNGYAPLECSLGYSLRDSDFGYSQGIYYVVAQLLFVIQLEVLGMLVILLENMLGCESYTTELWDSYVKREILEELLVNKVFGYISSYPSLKFEAKFGDLDEYLFTVYSDADQITYCVACEIGSGEIGNFPSLSGYPFTDTDISQNYWSGYYVTSPFFKAVVQELENALLGVELMMTFLLRYCQDLHCETLPNSFPHKLISDKRKGVSFQQHGGVTGAVKGHVGLDCEMLIHLVCGDLKFFISKAIEGCCLCCSKFVVAVWKILHLEDKVILKRWGMIQPQWNGRRHESNNPAHKKGPTFPNIL